MFLGEKSDPNENQMLRNTRKQKTNNKKKKLNHAEHGTVDDKMLGLEWEMNFTYLPENGKWYKNTRRLMQCIAKYLVQCLLDNV